LDQRQKLWHGPKAGSPRITDFQLSAQPQRFETITVTIGYKNGQLLRLRVILAPARALDPWRWPKGLQLWGSKRIKIESDTAKIPAIISSTLTLASEVHSYNTRLTGRFIKWTDFFFSWSAGLTYEQSAVKAVVGVIKSGTVLYKTHAHISLLNVT